MQEINDFEERLKEMSKIMATGSLAEAEKQHKQLQKQVKTFLVKHRVEENDKLAQIQITIYNNLACIFQRKGKYKSSIFYLQISQKLETEYFNHKYNGKDVPPHALQKLATTYSNMSALQSKIGNIKEALGCIEFAIEIMRRCEEHKDHKGFIYLYYNYAILLESNVKYTQACNFALAGKKAALFHKQSKMVVKFDVILERLKEHLARQQYRRQKEIKKYLKGEIGVVKNIEQINLPNGGEVTTEEKQHMKEYVNQTLTRQYNSRDSVRSKSFYHQNGQKSADKSQRQYALSTHKKTNFKSSSNNALTHKVGTIKSNDNIKSFNVSNQTISDTSKASIGMIQAYGIKSEKIKVPNMFEDFPINPRSKERRRKIEKQIGALEEQNQVLEKIIEKLYLSEKKP